MRYGKAKNKGELGYRKRNSYQKKMKHASYNCNNSMLVEKKNLLRTIASSMLNYYILTLGSINIETLIVTANIILLLSFLQSRLSSSFSIILIASFLLDINSFTSWYQSAPSWVI